ncbi:hypothetical protein [Streptomyces katrae]|uniref:hypothetical protein n=1 Tax=Streptomyces katrae TaxID=68223 RepID=UPI000696EEC9|nr:hypothetical protein [Streptomyces katrae]
MFTLLALLCLDDLASRGVDDMKRVAQRLAVFGSAAMAVFATAVLPTPHALAQDRLLFPAEIGIRFNPDGDPGQCGGRTGDQWVEENRWTDVIRFDTDGRRGGCQLAFGVFDREGFMQNAGLTYEWRATPFADPNQCGNQGEHRVPIRSDVRTFGPGIRIDTDDRMGGCALTFAVQQTGITLVQLDFQYYADGNAGQCPNALPPGSTRTVSADRGPETIGIDTDSRPGGCTLRLRLRIDGGG